MAKEKKTKTCSFRLPEEFYEKIEAMAKLKHCTKSEIIIDALNDKTELLNTKAIYKEMLLIHDNLASIERNSNIDTTEARRELMNLCQILNTCEKI